VSKKAGIFTGMADSSRYVLCRCTKGNILEKRSGNDGGKAAEKGRRKNQRETKKQADGRWIGRKKTANKKTGGALNRCCPCFV